MIRSAKAITASQASWFCCWLSSLNAKRPPEFPAGDAPEWTRTSTPERAQALNLLRMPIPPPGQVT